MYSMDSHIRTASSHLERVTLPVCRQGKKRNVSCLAGSRVFAWHLAHPVRAALHATHPPPPSTHPLSPSTHPRTHPAHPHFRPFPFRFEFSTGAQHDLEEDDYLHLAAGDDPVLDLFGLLFPTHPASNKVQNPSLALLGCEFSSRIPSSVKCGLATNLILISIRFIRL